MKKNILVFPCGSEIALEIHRSLEHSTHFNLVGCNSIEDHGRFVYKQYIGNLPFITSDRFIPAIKEIINQYNIDAVYPAMDEVIAVLKRNEEELGCYIISSCIETVELCLSKRKTYDKLSSVIRTPHLFSKNDVKTYPIFAKPNIGYGSRGVKKINSREELELSLKENNNLLFCEFLPGDEYTVDCFSDRNGKLLFWYPRIRGRIQNGISVYTRPVSRKLRQEFQTIVEQINHTVNFRGAWFVQLKRDCHGKLCLLEIASRFGGSSSLFRALGVNFAQLTLFDAFNFDVNILQNEYPIEMDRALDNIYNITIDYNEAYVDFDDCIFLEGKYINTTIIAFLYNCINQGVKITLLTKHKGNLQELLKKFRLQDIFDRIIQINENENKVDFIDNLQSIFIDDSYSERKQVKEKLNLPVFSIDMVKCLIK